MAGPTYILVYKTVKECTNERELAKAERMIEEYGEKTQYGIFYNYLKVTLMNEARKRVKGKSCEKSLCT